MRNRYSGAGTSGTGPISATLLPPGVAPPFAPSVNSQTLPAISATKKIVVAQMTFHCCTPVLACLRTTAMDEPTHTGRSGNHRVGRKRCHPPRRLAFRKAYPSVTISLILTLETVLFSRAFPHALVPESHVRYLFQGFALDADRRELLHETEPVPVEPQVFDLLLYLIRNRGRVVTKDDP